MGAPAKRRVGGEARQGEKLGVPSVLPYFWLPRAGFEPRPLAGYLRETEPNRKLYSYPSGQSHTRGTAQNQREYPSTQNHIRGAPSFSPYRSAAPVRPTV